MARWTTTDNAGTVLVIITEPGGPVSIHMEPAGKSWHGTEDRVQEVRIKLGAAIGIAQSELT
jgi:hypothetical protein